MPRFAANLTTMFNEVPFLERFEAAAINGFQAVEFLFPYDHDAADIAEQLRKNKLQDILFNLPPGDWRAGERGLASLPGRENDFSGSLQQAIAYAIMLEAPLLHVLSGLCLLDADHSIQRRVLIENLKYATTEAAKHDITLLIEPLSERNMPNYFLTRVAQARAICGEVGAPNLKIQMDLFHTQAEEGDLAAKIRENLPHVGHIQIAGAPERHEPNIGEISYPYLFQLLDDLDYQGWVGCEYYPAAGTIDGLAWMHWKREEGDNL